jgi:5-methylcytosine-specific restriction endonuclease McrA
MSSRDYLEYLESPEWWTIRKQAVRRADYCCERCGNRGSIEVHHRTYCRLGDESAEDLEVLCSTCHRAERVPKNRRKRVLEQCGQLRLFDRWDLPPQRRAAA